MTDFFTPSTSTPLFLQPNANGERMQKPPFVLSESALQEIQFAFKTLDYESVGHITARQMKVNHNRQLDCMALH